MEPEVNYRVHYLRTLSRAQYYVYAIKLGSVVLCWSLTRVTRRKRRKGIRPV
jgi:hypothetical protein